MTKRKAILCVDDEAILLIALAEELRSEFGNEYVYETALNAKDAFQAIAGLEEDGIELVLVISDWLMPGMKGDEFLERVSLDHPRIRAIMITGQADAEAVSRVKRNGSVLAVLRKPWHPRQLADAIRSMGDGGKESP